MIILGTNSIKDTGFDVANSLRFNSGSSDYLNNTSVDPVTNRLKFTISLWVKRSTLGAKSMIGTVGGDSTNFGAIWFDSSDRLNCTEGSGGGTLNFITNRVFRDVSAWYNIILAIDTTQGTESNRVKIYVNGVQETSFSTSTYPGQNSNMHLNRGGKTQYIGRHTDSSNNYYFDGYMTEVVWVDGQQLSNTDLGEFDEDSSIWKPIDVSGLTFGNNGFYLDFEDSSALGNDAAGSNNFTVNNLTALDQSTVTCTNNFCTYNPLMVTQSATVPAMSEGNLKATFNNAGLSLFALSNFAVSSGKWFAEFKMTDIHGGTDNYVGIVKDDANFAAESAPIASGTIYRGSGQKGINGSYSSYGATYATGDIIGVALNCDDNEVVFYKNGASQGAISITADKSYYMWTSDYASKIIEANFGSPAFSISSGNADADGYGNFEYAVPSGYYALCTKNLAEYG